MWRRPDCTDRNVAESDGCRRTRADAGASTTGADSGTHPESDTLANSEPRA